VDHRVFKQALYGEVARIGAALASDRRLELLDLLAQRPRHVESLAEETGMSVANASQHLQVLRGARLVESEREGTRAVYRLADDSVLRLWLSLRDTAESRLAEVRDLARDYQLGPYADGAISREEFEALQREGRSFLIDVRPPAEFAHGHLDGAVSIPLEELSERLGELPRDRTIVTYCRGAYCLFAGEAVGLLREHGFEVTRLDEGWLEWRAERIEADTAASRDPV
jgi:rhodanese-related sulfurtransferase